MRTWWTHEHNWPSNERSTDSTSGWMPSRVVANDRYWAWSSENEKSSLFSAWTSKLVLTWLRRNCTSDTNQRHGRSKQQQAMLWQSLHKVYQQCGRRLTCRGEDLQKYCDGHPPQQLIKNEKYFRKLTCSTSSFFEPCSIAISIARRRRSIALRKSPVTAATWKDMHLLHVLRVSTIWSKGFR